MVLAPATRQAVSSHWAERLDCRPAAFDRSGVTVTESGRLDAIQLFRRADATVVGVPPAVAGTLDARADELADVPLSDAREWFETAFADHDARVTQFHGPTFFGYLDPESFEPVESDARPLSADDQAAFESLRAAVPAVEWEQADPQFAPGAAVGLFRDERLVAVASLGDPPLPHVSVVVHPDHRGSGHGRAVVSLVSDDALEDGETPQYRTLDAWPWSVGLAESLGYQRWATGALVGLG